MSGPSRERLPIPTPARLKRELRLPRVPFLLIAVAIIALAVSWVPLVFLLRARVVPSDKPRVHIIQDMDNQPRYSTQQPSAVFVDGRAMRPPVPGTVARGHLALDDHYERGFAMVRDSATNAWKVDYFQGLPAQVSVDARLLQRGRQMFNIYCATCHGQDGYGNGPINQRAQDKQEPKWVPPSNLHSEDIRQRSEGHLYNTIRNGIRNMPGYAAQIDTPDRWAIVAYVRALQQSQHAKIDDIPTDQRDKLR